MKTGIRHKLLGAGASVLLNGGALLVAAQVVSVQAPVTEPDVIMEVSLEPFFLSENVARESEAPSEVSVAMPKAAPVEPQPEAAKAEPQKARPEPSEPLVSEPQVQPTPASAAVTLKVSQNFAPSTPSTSGASSPAKSQAVGPAAPSSPAASPTASKAGRNHAVAYSALVRRHLEMFREYPRTAKRRREEGIVSVTFVINRQGQVLSAKIAKSSGHPALDQAALDMVRAAQPLPRPPADITGEQIEITVPAEFFLTK